MSTAKLNRLSAVALAPALGDRAMAISRDSDRIAEEDAAQAEAQRPSDRRRCGAHRHLGATGTFGRTPSPQAQAQPVVLAGCPCRLSPHCSIRLWWRALVHGHTGLDFAGDTGSDIMAVANGTITEVGWAGAYGNRTIETLEDGTEIWYCHQTSTLVNVGDVVHGGEHIGEMGSTGNTTGPHLHLEVRPGGGNPIDPFTALVYHGLHP
ncbi:MAG: M23 family metallopeptidase [Marmoricola sp.]